MSHYSMDLSEHLPLRLGCRAALWDGSVYLYRGRSECVAVVPLNAGEKPTPELIVQRVGMGDVEAGQRLASGVRDGRRRRLAEGLTDASAGHSAWRTPLRRYPDVALPLRLPMWERRRETAAGHFFFSQGVAAADSRKWGDFQPTPWLDLGVPGRTPGSFFAQRTDGYP